MDNHVYLNSVRPYPGSKLFEDCLAKGIIGNKLGFVGNFIFGDVAETRESIRESMDFFLRHCMDNHVYLNSVRPYPGSKLFEDCLAKGIIGNKLKFYERIDEVVFNMTSMPDKLWIPWIKELMFLGVLFEWAKQTDALNCVMDTELRDATNGSYSKRPLWKVWAKCPHCYREVYYREPLPDIGRITLWQRLFRYLRMIKKRIDLFLVNFKDPIFKSFRPVMSKGDEPYQSFVTGCPYCNKRFRVNIPFKYLVKEKRNVKNGDKKRFRDLCSLGK